MLRRIGLGCACAVFGLLTVSSAFAQTAGEDSLYDTSYVLDPTDSQSATDNDKDDMTMSSGAHDERFISTPLFFDDANPQTFGTMDFRLRFDYVTETVDNDGGSRRGWAGRRGNWDRRHRDASGDDFGVGVQWVWGFWHNWEFFADLPINLGDGRWDGDGQDGNYDITLGATYRFWEEETFFPDWMPAFSLQGKMRVPTGYRSSGIDGELRAILTKNFGGGCRGHFNAFAISVNGDNDYYARDFQWGFVFGVDAPISDDVYVMLDYMHRSSEHYGNGNMNMIEAGLEWKLDDSQSVHVSANAGLDDNGDTPNFGARLAYTYTLTYQ